MGLFAFKRRRAIDRRHVPAYVRAIPTPVLLDSPDVLAAYLHDAGLPTPPADMVAEETDYRIWLAVGVAQ